MKLKSLALTFLLAIALPAFVSAAEPPPKPKGPPPGGKGGPSQDSAEMQELLKSFNLTPEQRAKYDAAKAETGKQMRAVHEGKVSGAMPQEEVLKKALVSHKAFNAAVKEILTPEQFGKWEPLRKADHHKIAAAHKQRDEAQKPEAPK